MTRILVGDALEQLRTLPDDSVHCVVTSPPYWGLRDYGTGTWEGGAMVCTHTFKAGGTRKSGLANYDNGLTPEAIAEKVEAYGHATYRSRCKRCGARRIDQQLGLEDTLQEYVAKMVDVFREVRRVLRHDGTCWLNLGDSYIGSAGGNQGRHGERASRTHTARITITKRGDGLKPKGLAMVPARVAIALADDGWYLRSEIIWHKPNPMPESVRDRPTKAHEQIFLLTKSPTYYYDADAIKEPVSGTARARGSGVNPKSTADAGDGPRSKQNASFSGA